MESSCENLRLLKKYKFKSEYLIKSNSAIVLKLISNLEFELNILSLELTNYDSEESRCESCREGGYLFNGDHICDQLVRKIKLLSYKLPTGSKLDTWTCKALILNLNELDEELSKFKCVDKIKKYLPIYGLAVAGAPVMAKLILTDTEKIIKFVPALFYNLGLFFLTKELISTLFKIKRIKSSIESIKELIEELSEELERKLIEDRIKFLISEFLIMLFFVPGPPANNVSKIIYKFDFMISKWKSGITEGVELNLTSLIEKLKEIIRLKKM